MLSLHIIEHDFVFKIQVVSYEFRIVSESGWAPFQTVPYNTNDLLQPFIKDEFFLFSSQFNMAVSLDSSYMALLPDIPPFTDLKDSIFDATTTSV